MGRKVFLAWIFVLLFIPLLAQEGAKSSWGEVKEEEIRKDLQYLSSLGSRIPGYPGNKKAADFVYQRFLNLGLKNVKKEEFEVTIPVDKGGQLWIAGEEKKFKVYSLWPNLVRTSTLPPEGIEGKLLYGGKGDYAFLEGKDIKGNILLLDFNCGDRWIEWAMFGAQAIIFLEPENTHRYQADKKFLSHPLDIPRFWINREDGLYLIRRLKEKTLRVKLKARMHWEKVTTWNITGFLEGSDPELKKETIILSSFYDSISVVPSLSPGAENATGIVALLQIARVLKENPPARSILFLATSAHFQYLKGINTFIHQHLRREEPFKSRIKEPIEAKLFIGLDLSTGSDELGIWHGSREFYFQKFFAPFGKKFEKYNQEVCKVLGYPPENTLTNGISPIRGISWDTLVPEEVRVDGQLVLWTGTPSLTFFTINDSRSLVDTPLDTVGRLNLNHLLRQIKVLNGLLHLALNDKNLFPEFKMELKEDIRTLKAQLVTFNPRTSFVPSDPVKGAIAYASSTGIKKNYMGVRGFFLELTDEKGYAIFPGWTKEMLSDEVYLQGFYLDPLTGEIVLAPDLGVNGNENYPMKVRIDLMEKEHMIVLFPCKSINVFDLMDPAFLIALDRLDVFDMGNSIPYAYGHSLILPRKWSWSSRVEPVATVFAQPHTRLKVIGSSGPLGKRYLLLNSLSFTKKEEAEGIGFSADEVKSILLTPYQGAHDMLYLNEYRIRNQIKYGISNKRLESLHGKAREFLDKATEALKHKAWGDFMHFSRRALAIESRAYPDVKATSNDVIKGIIFYLAVLLPFAYFAERLVFGFPDIKRQLIGIFGIFIVIYWIMRMVHPAFKLANAPEVILLSFILLALSVIVVSLISGKFEEQMQQMKRERAKIYEVDVGRISATAAAFALGVSNMKRRKVRTFLTSVTLILLTFTVLSFTSVKTYLRFNKILRPNKPLYQGLLIRDRVWNPIEEPALYHIENEFRGRATLAPRAWFICPHIESQTFIKIRRGEERTFAMGLLGMTPEEAQITHLDKYLSKGRWFKEKDEEAIILPREMAELLNIKEEEVGKAKVRVMGKELTVIGILDSEKIKDLKDLDDERITPVNFTMLGAKTLKRLEEEKTVRAGVGGKGILESFTHMEVSTIPIVPYEFVMENGGTLQSVAVKFPKGTNIIKEAEDFVSRLGITIFTGVKDKVWVYSAVGLTSFSGIGNLVIPILIASLIVLNTMLGSVYERIKEIGTYSSVGLAPVHIAALFIAEASVYAVLGAVAGYLLGQVIAKVMTTIGFLAGLTLNYSSLSAVSSTLLVMAVVILSTIYPARKAAQMSVPDVTRRWVLPEPQGDIWEFDFPFTISGREILGLYVFFRNYFSSYAEESVGTFYTSGVKFTSFEMKGEKGYSIEMLVHLAPFDLGVSQYTHLKAIPTGEYGIYLIRVTLERKGGEIGAWKRVNRRFLDTLRKQFLVWRTLSPRVKEEYRKEGEEILKREEKNE